MLPRQLLQMSKRLSSTTTRTIDPVQEALLAEQCILVNDKDEAIGKASKRDCHVLDARGESLLHRAFSLFVFNEKNELLLQQRADAKITFPGLWTNTCCSHPLAVPNEEIVEGGLGARNAAQRRMFNELGVRPEQCLPEKMTYLTRILYASPCGSSGEWGEHELDYILFLKADLDLQVNPNEVKNTCYVARKDLGDFLRSAQEKGQGITPWFKLIAEKKLDVWWQNLDNLDSFKNHEEIIDCRKE